MKSPKTYQQITGAITAQGNATFTTFNINGNNDVTLAAGTTFQADGILKNGAQGNATISGPAGTAIKAANNAELVINTASSGDNLILATPILANGSNALTKAGAGTLTLNGANTYTGTTTIAAGTLTIGSTGSLNGGTYSGAIQNFGTLNYLNSANQTLSGAITGTGSLTKDGTGTLTLKTGTNTFSGGMRVNAGTLYAGTAASVGNGTITLGSVGGSENVVFVLATGTVANPWSIAGGTGNRTIQNDTGNIVLSGPVALNNNLTLDTIAAANSISVTGVITGNKTITIQNSSAGTGQTTLDGNSAATYNGAIQVNTGATIVVGGTGMNFGNSTVNLSGTAKLLASASGTIAGLTGDSTSQVGAGGANKTLTVAGSGNYMFNGVIAGNATANPSITMAGTGNQTLAGNNTYAGTTTVSSGTLTLSGNNTTTGNITISGGTLVANNNQALGTSTVALNGGTLVLASDGSSSTPNNVTTNSGSTITISSDKATAGTAGITHTLGTLSIYNTTLNIVAGSNVTGGSPSVAFGNVTLTNTGGTITTFNPTTASLSLAAVNMLGTNNNNITVTLDGTATGNTITGVISNVGGGAGTGKISLTKSNTSTWILAGNNTYTGATTVSGGTLQIGNGGTTGSLATTSAITNNGTLVFNRSNTITQGTDFITTGISGNGSLVQNGSGTLKLNQNNTYTGGTTINAGTIQLDGGSALGAPTGTWLTFGGNSTLQFFAATGLLSTRSVAINPGVTATIDTNGFTSSSAGVISGSGALTKSGAGSLTLSAANTYSGSTLVSTGTLALGNNWALQNSALDTSGAGNVTVTGFITPTLGGLTGNTALASVITNGYSSVTGITLNPGTGVTNSYSGAIANGAAGMTLTKNGTGTQILSGTNTYNGTTTVNAGTLLINGSTASSAFTVNNTGTLGGNGTIGGAVTVNSGGFLSPGNSPGLLTVGSLVLNSGSTTIFEINGIAVRGTNFDAIDITSGTGITLNGTFTINFTNGTALDNTTHINLFGYTGHTGDFTSLVSTGFYDSGGGSWTHGVGDVWTFSSGGQTLTFDERIGYLNVVPEPATWALLAFSLTTVMVLRRRRR